MYLETLDELSAWHCALWVTGNVGALALYFAFYITRSTPDQRSFMNSLTAKVELAGVILFLAFSYTLETDSQVRGLLASILVCTFCVILLCSFLGMTGIARISLIGPPIAGLLGPGTSF